MGKIIDTVVLVLYPVIVLIGLTTIGVRWTALLLLLILGRRAIGLVIANRAVSRVVLYQAVVMAAIMGVAAASGSPFALRIAPFAISLSFIALFARSLRTTPIIERFARLGGKELSEAEVAYCKKLTKVWVGVLVTNSALVFAAAFVPDETLWSILVGPVSYTFLGLVFVVEYPYRKWRFRDFNDKSTLDRLLRRLMEGRAGV